MNRLIRSGWLLLAALPLVLHACNSQTTSPETPPDTEALIPGLTGECLGQTLLGTAPRRFAPQVIPFDVFFHSVTVAPGGQEIYWAESRGIVFTRRVDGGWTTPALVSFSGAGGEAWMDHAPVLSPDNTKLFINSKRPYSSNPSGGWWRFWSRFVGGAYQLPEPLSLNSFGYLVGPFVAPDEEYILFNRIESATGVYYVSFRGRDGGWSAPQRLPQTPPGAFRRVPSSLGNSLRGPCPRPGRLCPGASLTSG